MRLGHVFADGSWTVEDCQLTTSAPFALEARCPPWTALLLEKCDGTASIRELHQRLHASGVLPASLGPAEFTKLVRSLISGGFLRLPAVLDTF
jgi:hypothetical protein